MIKDVKYIKNILLGVAHVNLFGDIGWDIDGNQFANELNYLIDDYNIDEIYIHINSGGGEVFSGLSIVSVIRNSSKPITCIIEGVAASMAGVIAVAGDTVKMVDYGKLMVHNARVGLSNDDELVKKALDNINDILRGIFTKRGIADESIKNFMDQETWFSADEAKNLGLIDEIISVPVKVRTLNKLEILNKLNINNKMDEQKIMELLGVSTPEEIQAAIESLIAQLNEYKTKEQEMEDACKEKAEAEAKAAVDKAIENKVASEDERESLMLMAKTNIDVFNKLTAIPDPDPKSTIKNNFKFQAKAKKTDNELKEEFASNLKAGTLVDYQAKVGEEVFNKSMNLYYAKK